MTEFKFETKKFALQALLEKASNVLPSKDILPVLKNFLVEVTEDRLRVTATDMELSVVATTQMVRTSEPGRAAFPGKRLLEVVKQAQDGDLTLVVEEGKAHISVGRASWNLMVADASDYPTIAEIDEVEYAEVDRNRLLGALGAVRYAAATETVRPNLMMVDVREGRMRAADGVRFQQTLVEDVPDLQIPVHAVDDLVKFLRATEAQTIQVGELAKQLVFRIGGDVFIANKLTVDFPDVDEVLLKPALANDRELGVDREELISALKRVRITADEETSAVVLLLTDGSCEVRSRDKYGNEAREVLDVKWESGNHEVAFNHVHLLEMLEMADTKVCQFFLGKDTKTRKSPLLLRDDESGTVGVLNQIRIDWLNA